MIIQQEQLNGSVEAFARAFSNLVKDATSHLPTREDLDNVVTEKVKEATSHLPTREDLDSVVTEKVKEATSHLPTREDLDSVVTEKVKEATAHLATKEDLDKVVADMATKADLADLEQTVKGLERTVKEGYQRICGWKDDMYKTFARKEDLRPSAFKETH